MRFLFSYQAVAPFQSQKLRLEKKICIFCFYSLILSNPGIFPLFEFRFNHTTEMGRASFADTNFLVPLGPQWRKGNGNFVPGSRWDLWDPLGISGIPVDPQPPGQELILALSIP